MVYKPKKYFIKTYGCQANYADTGKIAGILESLGFDRSESIENCDIFVVNTCSIRHKSEDKVYGLPQSLEKLDKKPLVIVAGCMVGSVTGDRKRYEFEELKARTPWVDFYINPDQISKIPNILSDAGLLSDWGNKKISMLDIDPIQDMVGKNNIGYVNVSYGCDNFCSFCVVPYAREKEISREQDVIIGDILKLVSSGFDHIMLCGQNVNSWGLSMTEKMEIRSGSNQKLPFASLLREVHKLEGVEKISFLSSNPFDFTEDLIDAIRLPKVDNFLHVAVQSGNNDVLKRMNRRHTIEDFIKLTRMIRKAKPDVELGTDIIVGFPGETREQFMDSVELFRKIKFNVAFISIYSARKGTLAYRLYEDDILLKEKKWRHAYLTKVWEETRPTRIID